MRLLYWTACILRRGFFSHRAHRFDRPFLRTVSNPQKAFGIQISQSVTAKDGCKVLCYRLTWCLCGPLCVLFFCVFLWEKERTLSMRWHTNNSLGRFFSHRSHRSNRTFWRTVSSPQNASGIQNSQNVTAKDGCKVLWYLPAVRPLWNTVCSVLLCFSVRKRTHPHEKESAPTVRERMFICEKQASPRADPSDWMRVVEGTFRCEKSM